MAVINNAGIDHAADIAEQIDDISSALVWLAQEVRVVSGDQQSEHEFGAVGYDVEFNVSVACPLSSFDSSTPPPITTEVTLDGVEMRVRASTIGQSGTTWMGVLENR